MRTQIPEFFADMLISDYKLKNEHNEQIEEILEAVEDGKCSTPNWRDYQVHLEPCEIGGNSVSRFSIGRDDGGRLKIIMMNGVRRDPGYGDSYTRLVRDGVIWMSDTKAEILDHEPVFGALRDLDYVNGLRVLINGGGIGVLTKFCLSQPNVARIDVVDNDPGIIELHQRFYNDPRVHLHLGDAYDIDLDGEWDVAWHDIWPDISEDNIEEMLRIEDKYRDRVGWQECWEKETCYQIREMGERLEEALQNGDWNEVKKIDPDF